MLGWRTAIQTRTPQVQPSTLTWRRATRTLLPLGGSGLERLAPARRRLAVAFVPWLVRGLSVQSRTLACSSNNPFSVVFRDPPPCRAYQPGALMRVRTERALPLPLPLPPLPPPLPLPLPLLLGPT